MSHPYKIEAEIQLTPLGVAVVKLYNLTDISEDVGTTWNYVGSFFPTLPLIAEYGKNDRADFIPCGGSLETPYSRLKDSTWEISCSTPNKADEIQGFKAMLPSIATAVDLTIESDEGFITDYHLVNGLIEKKGETRSRYHEAHDRGYGWGY